MHRDTPLIWLPTGLLLGGAIGEPDRSRSRRRRDGLRQASALARFQRRGHGDHGRRDRAAGRDRARRRRSDAPSAATTKGRLAAMELQAGPEHAGSGSTCSSAAPLGSRSRAQRLIDAGAVTVGGRAPSQSATCMQAGEVVVVDERDVRPRPRPDDAPAPFARRLGGRAPARRRQAGRASSCTPRAATRTGTLVQALAGRAAGGEEAERPGIVHRLDRDTSGLLVVARSEKRSSRAQGGAPAPRDHARVPGARRGPPAEPQRHDRRAAGPRSPRAHDDVDGHRRSRATP